MRMRRKILRLYPLRLCGEFAHWSFLTIRLLLFDQWISKLVISGVLSFGFGPSTTGGFTVGWRYGKPLSAHTSHCTTGAFAR